MTTPPGRSFGRFSARTPEAGDRAFLSALYLACRPDLGALPVPRSVVEGIARHQEGLRDADYAVRYPHARSWLVEDEGGPVAWVLLARMDGGVRVVDLAVDAGRRRKGVARAVLRAIQREEAAIELRVRAGNEVARALYASLGFRVADDQGEALEMRWTRDS